MIKAAYYEEAIGKAFNLGSGEEIKIKDMLSMVNKATGNSAPVIKFPELKWNISYVYY